MEISYDLVKNLRNIAERRLSFERVKDLDFTSAIFDVDDRKEYGETRLVALVPLDGRVHVLIFTVRMGIIRVISFRKAHPKEVKEYDEKKHRA